MATANQFQITLSFKAVMDGLNSFVNGYKSRMEEVAAFNQRITNGGAAIQRMIGQLGVVLGGAALAKYAKDAAEADRVQQQLLRTLQRVGESGAAEALNAQATALQKVTHFSDEAVSTVQRLLINSGLSAKQTMDLTEQVLDFAQETNQSAESAAALIARTLRGQTDELGRYNIKLDTSKGKIDALRDALEKYASGAARGAIADPAARENTARFADTTESLGRAVNRIIVPLQGQLIPLLEWVARAVGALANACQGALPIMGTLARYAVAAVGSFGLLKVAVFTLTQVINPLRTGFVLLAGAPLLQFSSTLAAATAGAGTFGTVSFLVQNTLSSWVGLLQSVAIGLSIAGAALAGWELGKMINELEVGGMKIKDWVAIAFVYIGDKFGAILAGLRTAWAVTKAGGEAFWDALKLVTIQGVLMILEAWNKLPFGQKLKADLAPLRDEFDRTAQHILGAGDRLKKDISRIDADRAKQLIENAELAAFIETQARGAKGSGPGSGGAAGAPAGGGGRKDLNKENFGVDQAEQFRLQTQLLEAQLAGDQGEADRLTDLLEELKLKQELIQLDERAGPLVTGRINAQVTARAYARALAEDELAFQRQMGEFEIRRADIEANRLLTDQAKQRLVNKLLAEQNALLDEKIAKDEKQLKLGATDQEKTRLLQEITALRKQLAENHRTQESTRDLSVGEGALQGSTSFLSSLSTLAQNAADAVQGSLNSALQNTSDLLYNIASGAMNFHDAWNGAILSVGQNFLRMATDMVSKMIWRATVERGLTALGVALHVGGETAKTAATTAGVGTRLAMVVKEALADVYHGAVAAFKALAGIPYVGPFLGAAAMAAAIAGGVALVSKIGHADGGIIRGAGGPRDDKIPAMLSNGEAVTRASVVSQFGEPFFNSLNQGVLDLGALPGSVARQSSSRVAGRSPAGGGSAAAQARQPTLIVPVFDMSAAVREMRRHPDHDAHIVDLVKRRKGEILES